MVNHKSYPKNTLADSEFRKSRKETEWTLDRGIFHEAVKKIHVEPQIDLFAFRLKNHLSPTNLIRKQWLLMPFQSLGNLTFFMLFLPLVSSQKCYRKSKQRRPQDCRIVSCAMLADATLVAIGNETAGSGTPYASKKETHLISTSTARLGASTTSEAHPSDMPLVRKSLEGRGLSESATSLILQCWRRGTQQQYKPFIAKWEQYCSQRKINHFSATLEH